MTVSRPLLAWRFATGYHRGIHKRHVAVTASRSAIREPSEPVRVLQVTDPHLFADVDGSLRGTKTYASLASVLAHIVDAGWPADLVVMTGDLIQDDTREAYDRLIELMEPLGLPVYCIPGNHDVRELMREALSRRPFHYCDSVVIGNWLITGIDSCVDGDAGGRVSAAELDRLEALLGDTDAEHVMVCLHHPPLPVGSKWLDAVGLHNGADFADLIARAGNVRVAIFGHVHQDFDQEYDSVRIIGTPSTCRQFEPLVDEFALDDNPPGYRRITLYADGSLDSELIWVAP